MFYHYSRGRLGLCRTDWVLGPAAGKGGMEDRGISMDERSSSEQMTIIGIEITISHSPEIWVTYMGL